MITMATSTRKAGGNFAVIHCNGEWQPQIDPSMLHFRLQLVNRHGTRLQLDHSTKMIFGYVPTNKLPLFFLLRKSNCLCYAPLLAVALLNLASSNIGVLLMPLALLWMLLMEVSL